MNKNILSVRELEEKDILLTKPYALNPESNKLLQKAGFTFIKEHITTSGAITFE